MQAKTLKTLLAQADELLAGSSSGAALSKVASAEGSEVSALAQLLSGADTDVTLNVDPGSVPQEEIDKIAESLNRVQTASELNTLLKLAQFEKRAHDEGYTDEQLGEAFSKLAAETMARNLPVLAAMGFVGMTPKGDKNSLPAQPTGKTQGKLLGRLSLTRSLGY